MVNYLFDLLSICYRLLPHSGILKLIQGILHVFKCAVFVVLAHSVFRLHFFMIFFVYFRNNSYLCPWKQLVHGLGCVFKTYWFDAHTAMPREGTTAMTSRKDVYKMLVFWLLNLVNLKYPWNQATVTSTWVIYISPSLCGYIITYSWYMVFVLK